MGRKQACRELDFDAEKKRLDHMDIVHHSLRGKKNLDEAPSAYKDIHEVIAIQKDLVKVITELTTLAVIKG